MSEFWQTILMKVLDVLIPLLIPAFIAMVSAYAASVWQKFQEAKPNIAYQIENAAEFAVKAAEQMGLINQLETFMDSKLDYALDVAQRYLDAQGFKNIDLDLLRAAIEAEVLKQFPKAKLPPAE